MSIEAMKQALEKIATVNATDYEYQQWAREALAIAEAEKQEPVAMRYDFDGYGYKYIDAGSGSDWQTRIKDAEPVFAHPQPKREWVGLTEEDRNDCLVSADPCECLAKPEAHQLMEDVETKLREKNGG